MDKPRTQEDKNVDYLESRYMYEKRQKLYIANEETNQVFDETDVPDFINAWNEEWTFEEIAEYLGADQWELYLLAVDLLKKEKISGDITFKRGRLDV